MLTGWGPGVAALPGRRARARRDAAYRCRSPRPALDGERFRRATRECLLGRRRGRARCCAMPASPARRSGAAAPRWCTSRRRPTAPPTGTSSRSTGAASAAGPCTSRTRRRARVPAEVAIEFGLTGPYVILIGGAAATVDALWQAEPAPGRRRVRAGAGAGGRDVRGVRGSLAPGALARRRRPLVEAAACALLVPGEPALTRTDAAPRPSRARARGAPDAGRRDAARCAPLIALALARVSGGATVAGTAWHGPDGARPAAAGARRRAAGGPWNRRKCSTS